MRTGRFAMNGPPDVQKMCLPWDPMACILFHEAYDQGD
jgi:hypothetical protein